MIAGVPSGSGRDAANAGFAADLLACLASHPHRISPKYFYDDEGSRLFDRICALPEYYLTRTELEIFDRHAVDMAACIGRGAQIVEFGAGSLLKARLLLDALDAPRRFVPVDLSGEHLRASAVVLQDERPDVHIEPVVADFTHPAPLQAYLPDDARRIGFFPGSTIGNFSLDQAEAFLGEAARLLAGGGLLIGVDLVKDPHVLHRAYNDADGITAVFNLNLLARANRELGADFRPEGFHHHAFYHARHQRIEMHLISRCDQDVSVCDRRFTLSEGESIHTENSQKYTIAGFRSLASRCGFRPRACWCDSRRYFSVHWLETEEAPNAAA